VIRRRDVQAWVKELTPCRRRRRVNAAELAELLGEHDAAG
jgi:hypothetical protein